MTSIYEKQIAAEARLIHAEQMFVYNFIILRKKNNGHRWRLNNSSKTKWYEQQVCCLIFLLTTTSNRQKKKKKKRKEKETFDIEIKVFKIYVYYLGERFVQKKSRLYIM